MLPWRLPCDFGETCSTDIDLQTLMRWDRYGGIHNMSSVNITTYALLKVAWLNTLDREREKADGVGDSVWTGPVFLMNYDRGVCDWRILNVKIDSTLLLKAWKCKEGLNIMCFFWVGGFMHKNVFVNLHFPLNYCCIIIPHTRNINLLYRMWLYFKVHLHTSPALK